FNLAVLIILVIDLGLFNRKAHIISTKEATIWTLVWITLSLMLCGGIWMWWGPDGPERAQEFFAAYVLEYSLSVDNLFVFIMVFSYFKVAPSFQHRLLFWGILGAFVMRAGMIIGGAALVERFHWMLYIFGAFLLITAIKMLFAKEKDIDPEKTVIVRLARRVLPVAEGKHGEHFFIREHGKLKATHLFIALIFVEAADLLFAIDSIPAVLGVTRDPFIAYSSNICAILGLRSLFFVVGPLLDKFHYLKFGVVLVLGFIGVKMIVEPWFKVDILISLSVIGTLLASAMIFSVTHPPKKEKKGHGA
ncbi:MAG: TerC family protein, partial [Planctomycetes bacterium]|nr:TerC family protein [Planctomycetota bacterium]